MILLLLACTPTELDPGTGPCVWNQAYQEDEDAAPDSLSAMLAQAQDCYTLVDPFDEESESAVEAAIPTLQASGNQVGCYVSVGTCEDWRSDYDALSPYCVDEAWDAWEGEYFVSDTVGILPGMKARLDAAAELGCDWVELDNMDWAQDDEVSESTGVSEDQSREYAEAICAHADSLGMQCMGKSSTLGLELSGLTVESYPREQDWWEHSELQGVLDRGGLGIVVHYQEGDCAAVANEYRASYGSDLSVICEEDGEYLHL